MSTGFVDPVFDAQQKASQQAFEAQQIAEAEALKEFMGGGFTGPPRREMTFTEADIFDVDFGEAKTATQSYGHWIALAALAGVGAFLYFRK